MRLPIDDYTFGLFEENVAADAEEVYNNIWELLRAGDDRIIEMEELKEELEESEGNVNQLVVTNNTLETEKIQLLAQVKKLKVSCGYMI